MSLAVELRKINHDVAVIALAGRLVLGNDCQLEHLTTLAAGTHNMILDLSRLTSVDCAGVGVLAACARGVTQRGGTLSIVGAKGIIREVLAITHLNSRIRCFQTVKEAVGQLQLAEAACP